MEAQVAISLLIFGFVVCGVIYDVELSPQGRLLRSRGYRWRRLQNWFPLGVAYAAFYMARYNVSAGNIPTVRAQLGFSTIFMGWTISSASWVYAVTAPFTGKITDRIGGKNGMIVACLGASIFNLSLGVLFLCETSLLAQKILFIALYAANYVAQGFGTSAVVKINAAWYAPSERGLFAGVFNTMLTSGYYLSLGTGSSIIETLGWAYVFIIPGGALLVMSVVVMTFVQSSPADTSNFATDQLPACSTQLGIQCTPCSGGIEEVAQLTPKQQMKQLLRNRTFLGYLAALFFLCWVRDGFLNWFLSFFDDVRSEPLTSSDTAIIGGAWTIGGFVGGILCGWISDAVFHSDRVMPIFIFSFLQAIVLGVIYFVSSTCSVVALGALTFFSSVFILGNYTLLSYTVPTDLPQDIAAEASGYLMWAISLMVASVLAGAFVKLGSYLSEESRAKQRPATVTPLPECSHCAVSMIHLDGDFVRMASPTPD